MISRPVLYSSILNTIDKLGANRDRYKDHDIPYLEYHATRAALETQLLCIVDDAIEHAAKEAIESFCETTTR